ncbi:UNVERIFIED_ORG: hypothetical protein E4P37_03425 [Bacillus sp. AZ43]
MHIRPVAPTAYATIHQAANPALRAALDTLPRWVRATRALDALADGIAAMPPTPAVADLADELHAALLDGHGMPGDLSAQVGARIVTERVPPAVQAVLEDVAGRLTVDRDAAVTAGSDTILAHLHAQLGAAVDTARDAFADLGHARDEAAVIATGATEAWTAVHQAAATVADIRTAQRLIADKIWFGGGQGRGAHWPSASVIANTLDVFPAYGRWKAHGFTVDAEGHRTVIRDPRPEPGTLAHLEWLATGPARPWVPTRAEYDDADAALTAAVRAAHAADPAPRVPVPTY